MATSVPHFLRFARRLTSVSPRLLVPVVTFSMLTGCGASGSEGVSPAPGVAADTSTNEGGGGITGDTSSDAPMLVDAGISPAPDTGDAAVADSADATSAGDAPHDGETIPPGGPMAPPELPADYFV